MIEPHPDTLFIVSVFAYSGAIFAFVSTFFVFRILYLIFIKNNIDTYWRNATVIWVSNSLMFGCMALILSAQLTEAVAFSELNLTWGLIGTGFGIVISSLIIGGGYLSIKGTKFAVNFINSQSKKDS